VPLLQAHRRPSDERPQVPRAFGGTKSAGNIVRCCLMCNKIKDSRPYSLFVALFGEFLAEQGEEYRAADPDEGEAIGRMHKKFNNWLHSMRRRPLDCYCRDACNSQ
jgi:hypothetical protein